MKLLFTHILRDQINEILFCHLQYLGISRYVNKSNNTEIFFKAIVIYDYEFEFEMIVYTH